MSETPTRFALEAADDLLLYSGRATLATIDKHLAAAEERGRRRGVEEAALAPDEAVKRLTAAMREADRLFEQVGGSTRHHVRDCLLPLLEKHGLLLIDALAPRDSAPASVCANCGKADGHWSRCPSHKTPRDSGKEG